MVCCRVSPPQSLLYERKDMAVVTLTVLNRHGIISDDFYAFTNFEVVFYVPRVSP